MMSEKIDVLYVDDELTNLFIFEKNFEKIYSVISAASGNKGLEELSNNPEIKIVISDMKMPGMNGVEFIKKAKQDYPAKEYFMLSGFEMTDEIYEIMGKGIIRQYFQKPFNKTEIIRAIDEALAS